MKSKERELISEKLRNVLKLWIEFSFHSLILFEGNNLKIQINLKEATGEFSQITYGIDDKKIFMKHIHTIFSILFIKENAVL